MFIFWIVTKNVILYIIALFSSEKLSCVGPATSRMAWKVSQGKETNLNIISELNGNKRFLSPQTGSQKAKTMVLMFFLRQPNICDMCFEFCWLP